MILRLLAVVVLLVAYAKAGNAAAPGMEDFSGFVVRESVGIERFCRSSAGLAFIEEGADAPADDSDRVRPRGRIVVSNTGEEVSVLIYPPPDVDHLFYAQMEFDSFVFGAGRVECPAHTRVLPVGSTGVQGLEFSTDENDELVIRFNR